MEVGFLSFKKFVKFSDSKLMTFLMTLRFGLEEAKKYAEGNPID
jgi:hypothetical protein